MTVYAFDPSGYGISHVQLVGVTYDEGSGPIQGNLANVHVSAALTLDVYEEADLESAVVDSSNGNLRDMSGTPIDQVTSSAGEVIRFQADFDVDLWVTPDDGDSWFRIAPSHDDLVARVAALEAVPWGTANLLQGAIITDGSSSDAYPDDNFLIFRPAT